MVLEIAVKPDMLNNCSLQMVLKITLNQMC